VPALVEPLVDAVPALVGVIVGGGITGHFQHQQRRADARQKAFDREVEALAAVHAAGNDWRHHVDRMTLILSESRSQIDVVKAEGYDRYRASEQAFSSALALGEVVGPIEQLENAEDLRRAFGATINQVAKASALLGSDEEGLEEAVRDYKACLDLATIRFDDYMRTTAAVLREKRNRL
jgi:hypothetical protein